MSHADDLDVFELDDDDGLDSSELSASRQRLATKIIHLLRDPSTEGFQSGVSDFSDMTALIEAVRADIVNQMQTMPAARPAQCVMFFNQTGGMAMMCFENDLFLPSVSATLGMVVSSILKSGAASAYMLLIPFWRRRKGATATAVGQPAVSFAASPWDEEVIVMLGYSPTQRLVQTFRVELDAAAGATGLVEMTDECPDIDRHSITQNHFNVPRWAHERTNCGVSPRLH